MNTLRRAGEVYTNARVELSNRIAINSMRYNNRKEINDIIDLIIDEAQERVFYIKNLDRKVGVLDNRGYKIYKDTYVEYFNNFIKVLRKQVKPINRKAKTLDELKELKVVLVDIEGVVKTMYDNFDKFAYTKNKKRIEDIMPLLIKMNKTDEEILNIVSPVFNADMDMTDVSNTLKKQRDYMNSEKGAEIGHVINPSDTLHLATIIKPNFFYNPDETIREPRRNRLQLYLDQLQEQELLQEQQLQQQEQDNIIQRT